MELLLKRQYYPEGCNGAIYLAKDKVCETIELPWRNNKRSISCVPEGRYRLVKRYHHQRGEHLMLANVPQRELILIHPANFALRELQGCIAPVTRCTGPGKGDYSRVALERLQGLVYPVLDAGEEVWLRITGTSSFRP